MTAEISSFSKLTFSWHLHSHILLKQILSWRNYLLTITGLHCYPEENWRNYPLTLQKLPSCPRRNYPLTLKKLPSCPEEITPLAKRNNSHIWRDYSQTSKKWSFSQRYYLFTTENTCTLKKLYINYEEITPLPRINYSLTQKKFSPPPRPSHTLITKKLLPYPEITVCGLHCPNCLPDL